MLEEQRWGRDSIIYIPRKVAEKQLSFESRFVVLCRTAHFRDLLLSEGWPWMPAPKDAVAKGRDIRGPRYAI